MKLLSGLMVTLGILMVLAPAAIADESLGEVILDSVGDEIRGDVRRGVRRTVCPPREQEGGFCNVWEDVDSVRTGVRRTRNTIRAIDSIF